MIWSVVLAVTVFHVDLCYWAAVCHAMRDLIGSKTTDANQLTCLVLGAGLGRLVTYCLDAANLCAISMVTVHVIDANSTAVEFLRETFKDNSKHVIVHDPLAVYPLMGVAELPAGLQAIHKSCDLVVSELLGCFGDDEFLPELTNTIVRLFLSADGMVIPDHWTIYCAPIQSHDTHDYLSNKPSPQLKSTYTMSLPKDCVFITTLLPIHSTDYHCPSLTEYTSSVDCLVSPYMVQCCHTSSQPIDKITGDKRRPDEHQTYVIHGLIGYFVASLYKHKILVDSRHTSHERNVFHWECFYMPLKQSLLVAVGDQVRVEVSRQCRETCNEQDKWLELNYNWHISANNVTKGNHGNIITLHATRTL